MTDTTQEAGFEPLFNGKDLTGWSTIPRSYGTIWPGGPDVLDVMSGFPEEYAAPVDEFLAAWR